MNTEDQTTPPPEEVFEEPLFEMHFEGAITEKHEIPALVLAKSLAALQKAVYFLALDEEDRPVNERARIPAAIENKYALICSVPVEGSYAVPTSLGNPLADLYAPQNIGNVAKDLVQGLEYFATEQFDQLRSIVPDRSLRLRLIEQFREAIPRSGSGINLRIQPAGDASEGNANASFTLSTRILAPLKSYLQSQSGLSSVPQTITGRLEAIDFASNKITILYPVTNRSMDCFYDEGVEAMLLQNGRSRIQVTGFVTMDENDVPRQLSDVESIQEVDLSRMVFNTFEWEGRFLKSKQAIVIDPVLDESEQLFCAFYEPFGLDAFAQTRDQLWLEINEYVLMLWQEYALEADEVLSPPALELKKKLLETLEEVTP